MSLLVESRKGRRQKPEARPVIENKPFLSTSVREQKKMLLYVAIWMNDREFNFCFTKLGATQCTYAERQENASALPSGN